MASDYLKQRELELLDQAEAEKYQLRNSYDVQIRSLQNQRQYTASDGTEVPAGCALGVAAPALLGVVTALTGPAMLIIGLIAGLFGATGIKKAKAGRDARHNNALDQQIQALNDRCDGECRQIDEKYARLIAQESAAFTATVKAARSKYGGHTAARPIVQWLDERFEKAIRNADRRPHVRQIDAVLVFRVEQYQLYTMKWIGYTQQFGSDEIFDFNINRFRDLPDFADRVGFAQAMAKLVQFDMMSRFPRDPVAGGHVKPVVVITSNDTRMELHYQVANPNYRPAVKL